MTEYEVTFEITGRCKRTFMARNTDDLWEQIEDVREDLCETDIESIEDVEVTYID